MIELVFRDDTCYALQTAKEEGSLPTVCRVQLAMDEQGHYEHTPCTEELPPYQGPHIPGKTDEVVGFQLMAHVGRLSQLSDWRAHFAHLDALWAVYQDDEMAEDEWVSETAHQAELLVQRLQNADAAETIRIWYSETPEELCGFYWTMALLKNSSANVTEINLSRYSLWEERSPASGWSPEQLANSLSLERSIAWPERQAHAAHWDKLVAEDAPLRAVVNGTLISVPEDFYDFVLARQLESKPCRVAQLIGQCLLSGPDGVNDWWYANRLLRWIEAGKVLLLEHKRPFYGSLIG